MRIALKRKKGYPLDWLRTVLQERAAGEGHANLAVVATDDLAHRQQRGRLIPLGVVQRQLGVTAPGLPEVGVAAAHRDDLVEAERATGDAGLLDQAAYDNPSSNVGVDDPDPTPPRG